MKSLILEVVQKTITLTGLELIVLGIGATLYGGTWIYIPTIFQCLLLSLVIQLGLYILKSFESTYVIVEYFVEMTLVLFLVLLFGYIFSWYEGTPLWFLVIVGSLTYIIGSILGVMGINSDIKYINEKLKEIKEVK